MQDIRDAIRERIEAAKKRYSEGHAIMNAAASEVQMWTNALKVEDARAPAAAQAPAAPPVTRTAPTVSLPDFVADQLNKSPMSKDDLRAWAEQAGYGDGGGSLGRSLHAVLVNMTRGGKIEEREDGKFYLRPVRAFTSLVGMPTHQS